MGLLSIIRKQKLKEKEVRLLLLGLDNSGKSTIVKSMLGQDVKETSPTMGFDICTVSYAGFNINIWDIGGQTSLRATASRAVAWSSWSTRWTCLQGTGTNYGPKSYGFSDSSGLKITRGRSSLAARTREKTLEQDSTGSLRSTKLNI
ncbi:hypothetical protein KL906_002501 [Ogataea polymorpha]|nr:hypothetical protein KL906_002501 [Ogataea polymorpha]